MTPKPSPRGVAGEGGVVAAAVARAGDRPSLPARPFPLYLRTLAGAVPDRVALAISLTVLGALTEGIGLFVLMPLLSLIGVDVQQGSVGRFAGWMAVGFGWIGLPLNLVSVLMCYVGLIACDAAIRRWQTVTYSSLQLDFSAYLRQRLHQVVMRAGWVQLTRCRGSRRRPRCRTWTSTVAASPGRCATISAGL